jgi:mono/diheme cytochrome c family protein/peroxiredoxin
MATTPNEVRPSSPRTVGRQLLLGLGLGLLALGASAAVGWLVRSRWDGPTVPEARRREADPELVARGRLVYRVHCASCHGPEGRGDGPSAAELGPPPRDFAVLPWKFRTSPAAVRRVITEGIPGTGMPPSGQALSPGDLDALVSYVLTLASPQDDAEVRALLQGAGLVPADRVQDAPALEVRDTAGNPVTLAVLRGKLVLVYFWGTGCPPCLGKLPQLERLADEFRDRGVVVLAVCADEPEADAVRDVAARLRIASLPLYLDPRGVARVRYDVEELPTVCLIDRAGHLLGSGPGPDDWSGAEVRELLRACLAP